MNGAFSPLKVLDLVHMRARRFSASRLPHSNKSHTIWLSSADFMAPKARLEPHMGCDDMATELSGLPTAVQEGATACAVFIG